MLTGSGLAPASARPAPRPFPAARPEPAAVAALRRAAAAALAARAAFLAAEAGMRACRELREAMDAWRAAATPEAVLAALGPARDAPASVAARARPAAG